RYEIHEALNVIEHWNNVNDFIRFGKGGEFATNQLDEQEISMLALHLLQTRTKVLNNELDDTFKHWYPQFRAEAA
ncbi:MAG: Tn3 family transposase, partial [Bryobacteraceae bacterium]